MLRLRMDRRTDYKTALLIDAAIHEPGTWRVRERGAAARELAALGVPVDVAVRVLTRPAERRSQAEFIKGLPRL
jgi:hypothetical protein